MAMVPAVMVMVTAVAVRAYLGDEALILRPSVMPLGYDLSFGRFGTGNLYFDGPADVAVDADDHVYILDAGNHRIQVADEKGDFVAKWELGSWTGSSWHDPTALALDRDRRRLYVLDRKKRWIQGYSLRGELLGTFGKQGLREGLLDDPVDLTVDLQGMVYVLDRGRQRILQFTAEGVFRREFGGGLRDRPADPVSLGFADVTIGQIVLLDAGSRSLGTYERDGTFRDWEAIPPDVLGNGRLTRIRVDRANGLFLLDGKEGMLIKSQKGSFPIFSLQTGETRLMEPSGFAMDGKGRVYVADRRKNRVVRFLWEQP
jgi:sugar lactone lactonase YvrE